MTFAIPVQRSNELSEQANLELVCYIPRNDVGEMMNMYSVFELQDEEILSEKIIAVKYKQPM